MSGIDDRREESTDRVYQPSWSDIGSAPRDLERLVYEVAFRGELAALIALSCEQAAMHGMSSQADPGHALPTGVEAAIKAYADSKRTKEGSMGMEVRLHSGPAKSPADEPEVLPLSLAGQWVAWSSNGMKIVAAAPTLEEAERLAADAGEHEPILERHPGRYRL